MSTDGCDVVVVGTGAAGLTAALGLAGAGRDVVLMSKTGVGGGSTAWAQGGLAAVIDPQDSVELHVHDTLEAGAGLCDPATVADLVEAAPTAIDDLVRLGARFDTEDDGRLALALEGGHHARRVVHAGGDASGAEVSRTLTTAVAALVDQGRLRVVEDTIAVDAVRDIRGAVCGVSTLDRHGRHDVLAARAVVLATGGIGHLWDATTNPATSTGDGLALALRAGAVVRDVEFMQFHPTLLAAGPLGGDDRGVLVSEAVRGEGAVLRDHRGAPVMAGIHPLGDLAPRDVVAAALQAVMLRDGVEHVFLDGTALGAQMWQHHFPTILTMCRDRGIDPITEPIPVRPGAHYHCGGVAADLDGRTSLPGLYAIGEVAATGVHGANRLASNSLTEALVAGGRVVAALTEALPGSAQPAYVPPAPETPTGADDLGRWMARDAAVLRTGADLEQLATRLARTPTGAPAATAGEVEQANRLLSARAVVTAALTRTESRGCHRRADHRDRDPVWQRHQCWVWTGQGFSEVADRSREEVA